MKTVLAIVVGVLICVSVCLFFKVKQADRQIKVTTDTLYISKTLIDTIPIIHYRYVTRYETDTLYSVDSVKVPVIVPIRQSLYAKTLSTDSDTIRYRAYVSGYHSVLDSIRIALNYNRYINHTTIIQPRRHFYFSHGIQAGLGYGLFNHKPDVYVGYGITFNF